MSTTTTPNVIGASSPDNIPKADVQKQVSTPPAYRSVKAAGSRANGAQTPKKIAGLAAMAIPCTTVPVDVKLRGPAWLARAKGSAHNPELAGASIILVH